MLYSQALELACMDMEDSEMLPDSWFSEIGASQFEDLWQVLVSSYGLQSWAPSCILLDSGDVFEFSWSKWGGSIVGWYRFFAESCMLLCACLEMPRCLRRTVHTIEELFRKNLLA